MRSRPFKSGDHCPITDENPGDYQHDHPDDRSDNDETNAAMNAKHERLMAGAALLRIGRPGQHSNILREVIETTTACAR